MWKISRLYLKNFAAVLSSLEPKGLTIDLSANDNVLNILIGKMGSGKTAIMGHLQPFSSYGTLDVRNQYQDIIPEEDGVKEIDFLCDQTIFQIMHKYTWNNSTQSHNTKSYFKMNGVELNPNGNSGSFKELVREYFGIDQSYLRLLRLGPNVTNFIDMKYTERKAFIASLLKDADIYMILYKKLTEQMRVTNASITSLANKLIHLSAKDVIQLQAELDDLEDSCRRQNSVLQELQLDMFRRIGETESILNGKNYEEVQKTYQELEETNARYVARMEELEEALCNASVDKSPDEIAMLIGATEADIRQKEESIVRLQSELNSVESLVHKYTDMVKLSSSVDHMGELRGMVIELEKRSNSISEALNGFECEYTYHFLSGFIDELSSLKRDLEEVSQNDRETLSKLLNSDSSIKRWANQQIDFLSGKKYNLSKRISNLQFAGQYQEIIPMYLPPFCPTKDCPYYATHPSTIKRTTGSKSNSQRDDMIHRMQDESRAIDSQIDKYSSYPTLYERLQGVKRRWREAYSILSKLHIVEESTTLFEILTNLSKRHGWYNHNHLITILEKCRMRDTYYEVMNQLGKTKAELTVLENSEEANIKEKLEEATRHECECRDLLQRTSQELAIKRIDLRALRDLYDALVNRASHQAEQQQLRNKVEGINSKLEQLGKALEIIANNQTVINAIKASRAIEEDKLRTMSLQKEQLRAKLNDISYTQAEFDEMKEKKEILQEIIMATSSKEGIPLIMVKRFLDNCRNIINDLIADVFPDSLELLPFEINETEFAIPYIVDGAIKPISDIEAASQGQRAIISIAFSFALMRESGFNYNIPLLDEVDGPLYKKDRDKFTTILFKHLREIGARQVFLITHNNLIESNPANVIMTTEEVIDPNPLLHVIKLW